MDQRNVEPIKDMKDQDKVVLGHANNFWIWSQKHGYNLTHPPTPDSEPIQPRLDLACEITPVTIDPAKTALVIIDMQNFTTSQSLGPVVPAVHQAEKTLLEYAIPAARKAKIQIIWLVWGLTQQDLDTMSPGPIRSFGWSPSERSVRYHMPVTGREIESRSERRTGRGLGADLGKIKLEDGTTVDGGRVLMRDTWNAELSPPLARAFEEGQSVARPDVQIYKNRNSGMCDAQRDCAEFLAREGIRTLLFAGMNTDQCVMGTMQDANYKGFDTIMLKDGCATDSPEFSRLNAEFNCQRSVGFLSTCKELAQAVEYL